MESVIVELVSSASYNIFPNNTLSSFTNFLPDQLNFEGEWEVALLEITYPSMYNNVTYGSFWYSKVDNKKSNDFNTVIVKDLNMFTIESGHYKTLESIVRSIDESIFEKTKSKSVNVRGYTQEVSRKMQLHLYPDSTQLFLSENLSNLFGFPKNTWLKAEPFNVGIYPLDIMNIHSVMVYTDIVEYSSIGDIKAPILRCFPFEQKLTKEGGIVVNNMINYRAFENLQFRKLLKNSFHSIKVELRSQTGEQIPFLAVGLTRLTLMFRKKSARLSY